MPGTLIARRCFLAGLGLSAGGLALGFFPAESLADPRSATTARPRTRAPEVEAASPALNPNVYVQVGLDGLVTIVCHRSEMGQGIRSSLPALIADELGADMAQVRILQADGDPKYGDQNTDGSNSIRGIYEDMRRAGATPRMMLLAAAARRWRVDPASCEARDHRVAHAASGRSLGFGELAAEAGRLPIPRPEAVQLRPRAALQRVGGPLPLIDGPAYVTGTAVFGADVTLPGMLTAVIARPPVVGGRVATYDPSAALAIAGVRKVVELPAPKPPYGFQPLGGIAVLADNTWAAMRGRAALTITWEPPHGADAKIAIKVADEIDGTACLGAPLELEEPDDGEVVVPKSQVELTPEMPPSDGVCAAFVTLSRAQTVPLTPTGGGSLHPDSRVEATTSRTVSFSSVP